MTTWPPGWSGIWQDSVRPNVRADQRRAYRVVDDFEAELCSYTGAPFAVAVNSCTNALFLALKWEWDQPRLRTEKLRLPRHTYIGVLQSALNAGWDVEWSAYEEWQREGWYLLLPTEVSDSARDLRKSCFSGGFECYSFHSAKQLPLGRGGAILTDNEESAEWFRAARMDGRPPGSDKVILPGWHMPMSPDVAARGLDILSRWNDKGYSPPPLPHEEYADLSQWYPGC